MRTTCKYHIYSFQIRENNEPSPQTLSAITLLAMAPQISSAIIDLQDGTNVNLKYIMAFKHHLSYSLKTFTNKCFQPFFASLNMKILLMNTPQEGECQWECVPSFYNNLANFPPLGLLAIATEVAQRHTLTIVDVSTKNMSIAETVDYIINYQPDVLGISVSTRHLYPMHSVIKKTKAIMPDITIIAGGPHINDHGMATMRLNGCNFALSGYCEKTFPQFIEALEQIRDGADPQSLLPHIPGLFYRQNGEIMANPEEAKPQCLDDYPFPKRDLIVLDDYFTSADSARMTTMYTSRGCPYKCTFCDVLEKQYHFRSSEKIADEFEYIQSLGIKEIHIFDDTFNLNRKRVIDMCNELIKRKINMSWSARVRAHPLDREMLLLMKKAGCRRLQVGVESFDPSSLEAMGKKITLEHIKKFFALCHELDVMTLCYVILGFPEETQEYRDNFYETLVRLNPTYISLSILYPMPNTTLYEDLVRSGAYEKDHWTDFINNPVPNYCLPLCRSQDLHRELVELQYQTYRNFYLSSKFIFNDISRSFSPKMLWRKAQLALRMIFADSPSTNLRS